MAKSLLFLYMSPETGHQKAAEAVIEAATHMDPRLHCAGVDIVNYVYPVIGNVFHRMYLQMLQRAPSSGNICTTTPTSNKRRAKRATC